LETRALPVDDRSGRRFESRFDELGVKPEVIGHQAATHATRDALADPMALEEDTRAMFG